MRKLSIDILCLCVCLAGCEKFVQGSVKKSRTSIRPAKAMPPGKLTRIRGSHKMKKENSFREKPTGIEVERLGE